MGRLAKGSSAQRANRSFGRTVGPLGREEIEVESFSPGRCPGLGEPGSFGADEDGDAEPLQSLLTDPGSTSIPFPFSISVQSSNW
jgi:hypothetical protein